MKNKLIWNWLQYVDVIFLTKYGAHLSKIDINCYEYVKATVVGPDFLLLEMVIQHLTHWSLGDISWILDVN